MTLDTINEVWVITGGGIFPCGCFTSLEKAEEWIRTNKVTCTVTKYPLNECLYDYAVAHGYLKPHRKYQFLPKFKAKFSCANSEHYHYAFDEETDENIHWKN